MRLVLAASVLLVLLAAPVRAQEPVHPENTAAGLPQPVNDLKVAALEQRVKLEHARYLAARRRVHQLTRTLQHRSSTKEAIELACHVYGDCATLWRKATCESGLYRFARNPSGASGLFQFLPSTWESTPFAGFSIWSPYANALAAGWMHEHGRGGEWSCR